jgi:hypothetical protein
MVLHGTNDGKGIDPAIGKLPQLKQPPFSAWNSYKLVKKAQFQFDTDKFTDLDLPNEGKLRLKLDERTGSRFKISLAIVKGKVKHLAATVKANTGKIFFVAGPKYKGGILVLGIRVLPK